jgi:glycosyltransferase involved in cell wall biosynthesis
VKVAIVCSIPLTVQGGSGTAVSVRQVRAALEGRGNSVEILAPDREFPSLTVARWWFNRSLDPSRLRGHDVVLGVDGDAAMAASAAGRPYVGMLKGIYPEVIPFERGLTARLLQIQSGWERTAAETADAVVVPSRYSAEAVLRHYRVLAGRLHVVPEPFDVAPWRERLGETLSERDEVVLCVAHLYPRKRVLDLLNAWPLVRQARPAAKLRVLGHGPQLQAVRRLAAQQAGVSVEGHQPRDVLMHAFATSAVFCLPSAQENFGIAAVEAMASGLVLVLGDAGALPETSEGAVRQLVPVGAVQLLARAIVDSLDPDLRNQAESVNPTVAARYHPAFVSDRLEAVLREVAS